MADIGFTALKTINNVKKGASTASATIIRYSDGSIEFTDVNGRTKRVSGVDAERGGLKAFMDKIDSLV
jgi:hypothetical protein